MIYVDELYHYGVKGMKWGVRKVRPSSTVGVQDANRAGFSYKRLNEVGKAFKVSDDKKTKRLSKQMFRAYESGDQEKCKQIASQLYNYEGERKARNAINQVGLKESKKYMAYIFNTNSKAKTEDDFVREYTRHYVEREMVNTFGTKSEMDKYNKEHYGWE